MAPITTTTEIDRPPEEVFAYVSDLARIVQWQKNVVGGYMDGDGPHGMGASALPHAGSASPSGR